MFLHVIEHYCTGDKTLSAESTRVGTLASVVAAMNSESGGLSEGLAAHGAQIGPLAGVNSLVNDVVLAMGEPLAADVADQRPGPVNGLVAGQRLDSVELLGAGVAGVGYRGVEGRLVHHAAGRSGHRRNVVHVCGGRVADQARSRALDDRLVGLSVVIVQGASLEPHWAARTRVGLVLASQMDLLVPLQEGPVPKARLAAVAVEGLLVCLVRRWRHQRSVGHYHIILLILLMLLLLLLVLLLILLLLENLLVGRLVHPQVSQVREQPPAY